MSEVLNTASARVIDPILTTVVRGWRSPLNVGKALFPHVPVPTLGGKIISFGDEALRGYNTDRAPGGRVAEVQMGYEGKPFALETHSLDTKIPREWMNDARKVPRIELGTRAINIVMRALMLEQERAQAGLATTAENYADTNTSVLSGSDQWSHADSDPSKNVANAMEVVRSAIGFYPNVAVIGAKVYSKLRFHKALLELSKYTSQDSVSIEQLRSLWNLDALHIGQAILRSGEGSSATNKDVWGKNVILAYVPKGGDAQMENLSFGYTYTMQGHPIVEMPRWKAEIRSWVYGMDFFYSAVIAGKTSAYLFTNVVA